MNRTKYAAFLKRSIKKKACIKIRAMLKAHFFRVLLTTAEKHSDSHYHYQFQTF